ncbi:MAG: polyphosphate:AMP phosphotransferase [Clostridia bacterium]|jgi:polyphosphate:AMP phosphotransferase|nr:polyphosphate:AMP phosphotransferase [Clostridia bacterium]MBQ2462476.1 polyphosphate:AMP phosphotransferase [Clostridia bacterium]MBQ9290216.1 polyphosphate:AMP phosphotransferase [Clostridia bacterium]MBR0216455.1 polyphosphate:AMP phosphotransferase [Clostridia bacterium]
MLADFEKVEAEDKDVLKADIKELKERLAALPQKLRDKKIPVLVLIEGWAAAGKGSLIKELISELDPRFYNVVSPVIVPEKESRYPFLYPYATAIPENGKILFMDSGWMEDIIRKYLHREITKEEFKRRVRAVNEFERQLRDGGYLLLKIFVHIDKKEQYERLESLTANVETEWRVTDEDLWQHREYDRFLDSYDNFMEKTDDIVPWHILDGSRRKMAVRDVLKLLVEGIEDVLEEGRYVGEPFEEEFPLREMPALADVDLSVTISDDEYKEKLKKLQKRLSELHNIIYRLKIPVVLCYEGWDAAGKGGNIRRVAYPLDPRGFDVCPIASPEPHELNRQYLWRFWTRLPRSGHICIFDRTWYGRVMVERLEGFCSEKDWQRAYNEINEFERQLTDWGAVVIKFWIHIDQDTQLARFNDRQNTPEKQWKITDEDWRNREKWPLYEVAVNEMLQKTSTKNAPWYIIESNDKQYARIRTLEIIVKALEKACEEHFARKVCKE